ncbi:MAG: type III pantothenate kinase [Muribaculaceae bacterium]|nr:type III pantothenate kinase [Muribaculaceae bacterium]
MNRHLCIDCGNTQVKAALFSDDVIVSRVQAGYDDLSPLIGMLQDSSIGAALLSSTTHRSEEVLAAVRPLLPCRIEELTHETALPLSIAYRTPTTLGRDRIAAAVGAWEMFPGCNLLVVDAGTCVTMDVVTGDGTYLGGNIAPGVDMRLRAMHEFTSKLPQVDARGEVPLVGYDTETAIRAGAVLGAVNEIDGMAQKLRAMLRQLKVIVTGGAATLLSEYLGGESCTVEPDLVLRGLNAIIMFNEE